MPRFETIKTVYDYDDIGHGPLVLFGHGLSCDRHMFDDQVHALRDRYRCLTLDWPGHGDRTTFDAGGWSLDDLARDVAELIASLDAGPASLVGLSQGGMVFMRVAIDHPELVRAMALLDTSARAEPPDRVGAISANLDRLRYAPESVREDFIRDLAVPAFFGAPWRDANPDLVEREVALRLSHDRLGYELATRAVIERRQIDLEKLAALEVPSLVLVGELDALTPPAHAQELAASIPRAILEVIPGAGHHTPLERPVEVTTALAAFLDGCTT